MTTVTITTDQPDNTTILAFNVTGESGTIGFSNITIPKSDVPYGTTPTIYIDGQPATNQGFTQDTSNYYLWYTTHFSTHQISIEFTQTSSSLTVAQSSSTQVIYGVAVAFVIVAIVIISLKLITTNKPNKTR